MELKKTPFYQRHIQENGRMVDFFGWALAVEYESMLAEAKSVRKTCGMFDASHMGQIIIKGEGCFDFLQYLTCNDVLTIGKGQMQYNLLLNAQAGVIDDLMVYHLGDSLLCVVNALNKDKVFDWFRQNLANNVEISDESDKVALVSVQGEGSEKIIDKVFGKDVAELRYLHFIQKQIDNSQVLISRSGYTGEDGFEVYLPWEKGGHWWDKIKQAGKEFGLVLCGLGARDILRTEAGYPLYGHELNDKITPYQAGLGWVVRLNKDFIGKKVLLEEKQKGPDKKRIGFVMLERSFPRQDYPIFLDEKEIGFVTSGVYSPNKEAFIGMGYVQADCVKLDNEINISVRGRLPKAKVTNFPFVVTRTKKVKLVKEG